MVLVVHGEQHHEVLISKHLDTLQDFDNLEYRWKLKILQNQQKLKLIRD